MEQYKRLKRELKHKGAVVDFYNDTMQLPDGKIESYDFIYHKGAAAIVPVDQDGNILMVRQYRNAIERETLEIPAGAKNPDEDGREAAMREMEEETGYRAGKTEHLFDLYTTFAFCNEKISIFYTEELIPAKQHLDDDEFLSVERVPLETLIDMIFDGRIQDAKTIAGLLAYQEKRRRRADA